MLFPDHRCGDRDPGHPPFRLADAAVLLPDREAKPRNPRDFETIEGGRTRVSDTSLTKTAFGALRGAQPLFH